MFGFTDPQEILDATEISCRTHFGAGIKGSLFYQSSISCTHGLEWDDRRYIVIKVRPPAETNPDIVLDAPALETIFRITSWLFKQGYPCSEPLLDPRPLGYVYATGEAFAEKESVIDGFDSAIQRELTKGLAELIEVLKSQNVP